MFRSIITTAMLGLVAPVALTTAAFAGPDDDAEVVSSIMWQRSSKHVFFPGIQAVLSPESNDRTYRIEVVFDRVVAPENVLTQIQGSWPNPDSVQWEKTLNGKFINQMATRNPYMDIADPACHLQSLEGHEAAPNAYRCVIDLSLNKNVPAGTIGITLKYNDTYHPNLNFFILIPDQPKGPSAGDMPGARIRQFKGGYEPLVGTSQSESQTFRAARSFSECGMASPLPDDPSRYVVQVGLQGHFSIGSGFILKNISGFGTNFIDKLDRATDSDIYVATASHLFSIPYTHEIFKAALEGRHDLLSGIDFTVDLKVNGKLIEKAARVVGRDVLSDMAILSVDTDKIDELTCAMGVASVGEIKGLELATSLEQQVASCGSKECLFKVIGYPSSEDGRVVTRTGSLKRGDYPTSYTSNLGSLKKFRLAQIATYPLAERGLSGGPILNKFNKVVGIAIEKPTDAVDLVGLDITNITNQQSNLTIESQCYYHFNPFDGVFRLTNLVEGCNYGKFGEDQADLFAIPGEWAIQQTYAIKTTPANFSQASELTPISEMDFANSYALMNEKAYIDGKNIISGSPLDLKNINKVLKGGFTFNPDSFKERHFRGIRILKMPPEFTPEKTNLLGRPIRGTKENAETHSGVTRIYTMRDFVIWLHEHLAEFADKEAIVDMLDMEN
ncbi:MAG: hypothetical protein AB7T49_16405 [Oligoflexales bacterium]